MTDRTKQKTFPTEEKFDPLPPDDAIPHARRSGQDRHPRTSRGPSAPKRADSSKPSAERRAKQKRRGRIDPTTFEKQYSDDEIEFMNAIQRFKVQSGRSFPTYGEVLEVAHQLGYRKMIDGAVGSPLDDAPPS